MINFTMREVDLLILGVQAEQIAHIQWDTHISSTYNLELNLLLTKLQKIKLILEIDAEDRKEGDDV